MRKNKIIRFVSRPLHWLFAALSKKAPFLLEELVFPLIHPREILFILSKGNPDKYKLKLAKWAHDNYDFMQGF